MYCFSMYGPYPHSIVGGILPSMGICKLDWTPSHSLEWKTPQDTIKNNIIQVYNIIYIMARGQIILHADRYREMPLGQTVNLAQRFSRLVWECMLKS